jgi:LmbE family N-acetylglucosaminyl deacetylase
LRPARTVAIVSPRVFQVIGLHVILRYGPLNMTSPKSKVALAFMAHPDDAEMMCAGTLVRLAEAGWEIHIATVAPGDCGTMTENRWDISSIRTQEARKAAELIGGEYHCLDGRDGLVIYDQPTLQRSIDLFRRVAPSLVFTHPEKDYMMDHEMTHLLGRAASFIYSAPNVSAHQRLDRSAIPYLYYCDPVEAIDPLGRRVEPTSYVDISSALEKKTEMLACHASQREWLRTQHGVDEYIDAMKRHGAMRGEEHGVAAAEAFVQHRGHAYPADDLLQGLFG